jgi:hypothetical protein
MENISSKQLFLFHTKLTPKTTNHGDLRIYTFNLAIKRFDDPENTDSGRIMICVNSLNKDKIAVRTKIKKELEPENKKNVQTIDIDHFWEAFDNLKNCKSFSDSAASFQKLYLGRATNGLLDFIQVREFTAEKFVNAVSKNYAFYQAIHATIAKIYHCFFCPRSDSSPLGEDHQDDQETYRKIRQKK